MGGFNRRAFLAALAVGGCLAAQGALAQDYPTRPIKLVVPIAPGGPLDTTARILAEHLSVGLKQPVVVENKAGAATLLGAQMVANAEPDGYTIMLGTAGIASYSVFVKDPKIDVLKDFEFISTAVRLPYVLATTTVRPYKTVADIQAYAKANPDKFNYGTYGNHALITTEIFNKAAGVTGVRIPYSGSAPAYLALASGDIDTIIADLGTLRPLVAGGKATLIAVSSEQRLAAEPSIPTFKESGLTIPPLAVWYGIVAPAKTPKAIVDRLNKEIVAVGKLPAVISRLGDLQIEPWTSTPEEFRKVVEQEQAIFQQTAKAIGIEPQ